MRSEDVPMAPSRAKQMTTTPDWEGLQVLPVATIRDAIELIDATSMQVALVADENGRLLGTVTDGDIRRGILKGIGLSESVCRVMNSAPTIARLGDSRGKLLALMKRRKLRSIPLLDAEGRICGLETIDALLPMPSHDNWVVLMVGGLGSRLRPLTDDCPKPMLNVGGRPILETILESLIEHGFRRFFMAVNYRAEVIQAHFGDGSRWNVEIAYLHESERLGTAGALALLPERATLPLLVMNGDLLTKVNFQQLLDFHLQTRGMATVCAREYHLQIPYGVMRVNGSQLLDIQEKPMERFLVNAGIYVFDPQVLDQLPTGRPYDMPELIKAVASEKGAHVFPVREYWMDIGRMDDFIQANGDFQEVFV